MIWSFITVVGLGSCIFLLLPLNTQKALGTKLLLLLVQIYIYIVEMYKYMYKLIFFNSSGPIRHLYTKHKDQTVIHVLKANIDNKFYDLKVIHADTNTHMKFNEIYNQIEQNMKLRHNILNCSFVNEETNYVLDVTEMFREYVYHFDKTDNQSKVSHFLLDIKEQYDIDLDDPKLELVVYMNDDQITECRYPIYGVNCLFFKDICFAEN